MSVQVITISGNIASGKTTLLNELKKRHMMNVIEEWQLFLEPLDKWAPMIEEYGKNQKQTAYQFQQLVIDHYEDITNKIEQWEHQLRQQRKRGLVLTERSIQDVLNVFLPQNICNMSQEQYNNCIIRIRQLQQNPLWKNSIIVTLDTPPHQCLSRIQNRNRSGENLLPLTYLSSLDQHYRKMNSMYRLQSYTETDIESNCQILKNLFIEICGKEEESETREEIIRI